MSKLGRPKKHKVKPVGMFFNFRPSVARIIKHSKERKGLEQAQYIETCVAIADKQIASLKFKAYPLPKV